MEYPSNNLSSSAIVNNVGASGIVNNIGGLNGCKNCKFLARLSTL